jgi:hypothetical protein
MLGRVGTRTAWFARAVCTLSLALTALSVLLIALNLRLNTPAYFFWLDLTVLAIGYSIIGRNYKTSGEWDMTKAKYGCLRLSARERAEASRARRRTGRYVLLWCAESGTSSLSGC